MDEPRHGSESRGYHVPPEIYDIAVGWDPQPEIDRLLFLARQAGLWPQSALELGCGTGRLVRCLRHTVPVVCGIELSAAMAELGRARGAGEILVADLSDFTLDREFELIFTSANTIRHVLTDDTLARMWRCVAAHLAPSGVFIADLELGFADQAARVGKPAMWTTSRGQTGVHVSWLVSEAPSPITRCCKVEYTFEARGDGPPSRWQERLELRTYDAREFIELASSGARLELAGLYEVRDPYLVEIPVEDAVGRFLVVLQRPHAG